MKKRYYLSAQRENGDVLLTFIVALTTLSHYRASV